MPEVDEMRQRSCRRIFARTAPTAVHRGIHIEWHVVYLASSLGQMLHIAGIAQRHKLLVGIFIRAISFCPPFFIICLFCQWRVVACRLQHTYLVLYLHHDDHLALWVALLDVAHECRECLQVGLQHVVAKA